MASHRNCHSEGGVVNSTHVQDLHKTYTHTHTPPPLSRFKSIHIFVDPPTTSTDPPVLSVSLQGSWTSFNPAYKVGCLASLEDQDTGVGLVQ